VEETWTPVTPLLLVLEDQVSLCLSDQTLTDGLLQGGLKG
jgi:hypothetical protein